MRVRKIPAPSVAIHMEKREPSRLQWIFLKELRIIHEKGQETWLLNIRIKSMIIDEFAALKSGLHLFLKEDRARFVNKNKSMGGALASPHNQVK